MNLSTAIIHFLANEFKFEPDSLSMDTSFTQDLGLSEPELADLLQRLQDSLNFILPEERISEISTIGHLISIVEPEEA
jgi:acyl carrier protein